MKNKMGLNKAKKVLTNNGIFWCDFFDLEFVKNSRGNNWVGCEEIKQAIDRIQKFLSLGK